MIWPIWAPTIKLSSTSDLQQGPHSLSLVGMKVNETGNLGHTVVLGTAVFYACSFLAVLAPGFSGMGHGCKVEQATGVHVACWGGRALVNLGGFWVGAPTTQLLLVFEAVEMMLLDDAPGRSSRRRTFRGLGRRVGFLERRNDQ